MSLFKSGCIRYFGGLVVTLFAGVKEVAICYELISLEVKMVFSCFFVFFSV